MHRVTCEYIYILVSSLSLFPTMRTINARDSDEGGDVEKGQNLPQKGGSRPQRLIYASARDSVCAKNITHNREDRFSDGFTHSTLSRFLITSSSDDRSTYEAKIIYNVNQISQYI